MNEQRWQDWITTLIGFYVFLSPWVIPYFFPDSAVTGMAAWSHYVVGAAIVIMGIVALASDQLWEEWVEVFLGVWLVIAPWALGFAEMTPFVWNSVIIGVILMALSASTLFTGFNAKSIT
ncbi:SPW repeat protein [Chelativorans xinjiangense]|uniref:SPW repeat protein n=1 Tax=Chelativorans xinjiangense TaxID=2681485 RepID=UPI0013592F5B|nr:SPW repeat protein [Chelativorans xinjiangense]